MQKTVYTLEEKEIFEDHFLKHTDGHKKRFNAFLESFYSTLTQDKSLVPQVHFYPRDRVTNMPVAVKNLNKDKIKFNTNHIWWDTKTGDNLLTHFLSKDEFTITSGSLHQLNLTHPNWAHENKLGDTPLTLLAKRGQYDYIEKIIKDFDLNPNVKNCNDKYFTHFLLSTPNIIENTVAFSLAFNYIEKVIDEYPTHFMGSHIKNINLLSDWQHTLEKLQVTIKNYYTIFGNRRDSFDILREQGEKIKESLEKFSLTTKLEKNLGEKDINVRKAKI